MPSTALPIEPIAKDLTEDIPQSLIERVTSQENMGLEEELEDFTEPESPAASVLLKKKGPESIGKGFRIIKGKSEFKGPYTLNGYIEKNKFDDKDSIAFYEGKIVSLESVKRVSLDPGKDLLAILSFNFRSKIVNHLAKTFNLDARAVFTFADYKRVIITLLASLYDSDFRMLFDTVKGTATINEQIGCASLLTENEKAYLRSFDSFDDVDQEGRKLLIDTYYRVANFDLDKIEATTPEMAADLDVVQAYYTILPKLRREQQEKLSRAEYLAKVLAYLELNVGQVVKVPRRGSSNKEDLYIVRELLPHKDHNDDTQAVICRVLTPYAKSASDALVLVRGTQTGKQVAAWNSLIRDADSEGVGKQSFIRAMPIISEMIEKTVATLTGDKTIEVEGHSLAGVDAQRVLYLIMQMINKGILNSVKKLIHFSHNPPGVAQADAIAFDEELQKLDKSIDVEMNFIVFTGDIISWFGSIYNGAMSKLDRIKGEIWIAQTTRWLLAAHTCVSTRNDLEETDAKEMIEGKITYTKFDIQSNEGKKFLLKDYAKRLAAINQWVRLFRKQLHKPAFIAIRSFGRWMLTDRKIEDRPNLA